MQSTDKALRISATRCIAVLAILFCRYLHAQPNGKAQPIETPAQVLALSADPKARVDYAQVGRVLIALPPAERKRVHAQLIAGANSGLASMAARVLVTEGDPDAVALVGSHILSWPVSSQGAILQHLAALRASYLEIPGVVLREAIKTAKTIEGTLAD